MENINKNQFWVAISILLNNYHTINRKLCACVITAVKSITKLKRDDNVDKATLFRCIQNNFTTDPRNEYEGFIVHFRCLHKNGKDTTGAAGILDFNNTSFRLTFESDNLDNFEVKLHEDTLHIDVLSPLGDTETGVRWSQYILKPKLLKWAKSVTFPTDLNVASLEESGSLRLLNIEKYNKLYVRLKHKYSENALKFWNAANESTDPLKFIYEDLAIAAYLITLWQSDEINHSPKAFADLGCGNGLLVYILIEEGYTGYGYDVRCRKIWSFYPLKVGRCLYEQTIEPFKYTLPADVDWLIGNHSDELSPWIPVIAATTHYRMNYFLLPCCAFEFSGRKFQRRNSSVSGYKDFCNYAEKISIRCGFQTEKDRLKIPSTKRIAFIGRKRVYSPSDHLNKTEEIKQFVFSEQKFHPASNDNNEIKLRDKVETVRNCTQIDKATIYKIVIQIFMLLLNEKNDKSSSIDPNRPLKSEWLTGRSLSIADIAKYLKKEDLKEIKSECGGIKTLLRNKHEIFELHKPDLVKIRKPQLLHNSSNKPQTVKKRMCFFKEHHPQGCPLSAEECTFIH